MKTNQLSIFTIIIAIAITITSGCSSSNVSRQPEPEKNIPTNSTSKNRETNPSSPSLAKLRAKPLDKEPLGETINTTIYTSDTQCQKLIPKQVAVSANKPINAAIAQIIEQQDSGDFNLSGYRLSVKNGTATIDLRIAPKSRRQIMSLSSCEQFALFGSLRKTLTSNPQWNIKRVRFTQLGEDIIF
ncbi:MAG: hypothetical protein QNJ51_15855 [Calothrix sp. MO_167.B12]|nr:hypothetical protein [Calothrix sp. MO_167.B12]